MTNKPLRVIIDTNLLISFLISNNYSKLDEPLESGKVLLLFGNELLAEFLQVAKRPKFKKYFSPKSIEQLLDQFDEYADFVEVITMVDTCRDAKDNFLLSLAVDGSADFLITGDQDLLIMKEYSKTKIITLSEFLTLV